MLKNLKIWDNSQIMKGAEIGDNVTIGHNCYIYSKAKIGSGCKIQSNTDIWDLVTLEEFVFVGPSVVFTNDLTPRAEFPKKRFTEYGTWQPTLIKRGASIGANATILCGITIGKYAMIGAGAVVNKDVAPYAIVVGNPAELKGFICQCGNKLKHRTAICQVCQRKPKLD